ncbi:MAG: hypothetical protein ACLRS8_16015 [Parabacteroides merdae]
MFREIDFSRNSEAYFKLKEGVRCNRTGIRSFRPIPVSVTKQEQVGNKICLGFFDADPVNNCTDEDLAGFKERIRQLGIKKTDVSESIMRVRKQYPRHYETWSDEECRILQEFMQKTNDLNLFCSCFQRTPGSIRIKVEGMNQN